MGGGGNEGALARALARLAVVELFCPGLCNNVVWEAMVSAEGCQVFAGVFGTEELALGGARDMHKTFSWSIYGAHKLKEEEGGCSTCGVYWRLTQRQLLTALPPAQP